MPKRPIYLQPPDDLYRRTRRDLEFLCNYWDRLLASNQSYDVRLPELLRANHLMRQLSSLPSDRGLRVNVSFTILDDSDRLEPQNVETYQLGNASPYTESHNAFRRSPCNGNTARHNDLLRNCVRRMNENYAAVERELMRTRVSAPLVERDRFASAFYNQRAPTCNWNKFPAGSRACSARMPAELQERHVNSRERSDRACALYQHECCIADGTSNGCSIDRQPARQKENSPERFHDLPKTATQHRFQDSPRAFSSSTMVGKLQSDNNALQNRAGTALDRNDNATIKLRKEPMEACQGVSKIINETAKTSLSVKSPSVKSDDVAINESSDSQPVSYQRNLLRNAELSVMANQSRYVEGQGRGNKRKLDDLEDRATAVGFDLGVSSQQDQPRAIGRIKPRVRDALTIFSLDEKTVRNRIRNVRMPTEGRPSSRRRVSAPKYASFLRMFRKEETDERIHGNSSSRRDDGEKSQRRRGLSTENTDYDNRTNPRIERRTPTPRSTVHTTYNPIMHSSATDPILDSSGITIQLLRLAVLLYAPALMPSLNSLIAQQNQQTLVSMPSSFEGSNDLLMQIFRLLNEQQSIPNLPFVSVGSERVPSALKMNAETNAGSSQARSEGEEENISVATEGSPPVSRQGSISAGTSGWKPNNRVQQQNGNDRKWRLTSMLTNSGVRLDRNIFTTEDFRRFEEFLRAERKRPENVRSLSTRNKNEIVMREYFQNWLRRLLQQLNAASNNLPSNNEETVCPERSSKIEDKSSLEEIEEQQSTDRLVLDESPDSSKEDENIFTEHEDEDSDDQKSFTSATSTSSSRSQQLKQDDARKDENERTR